MAKIVQRVKPLEFTDGESELRVHYDNRGEPYREGVTLAASIPDAEFELRNSCHYVGVMLDARDVRLLRDKLSEFLGEK